MGNIAEWANSPNLPVEKIPNQWKRDYGGVDEPKSHWWGPVYCKYWETIKWFFCRWLVSTHVPGHPKGWINKRVKGGKWKYQVRVRQSEWE